jgi:WD40 repeat protein
VSPSGRRVISGGADGAVQIWDVQRGEVSFELGSHPKGVEVVAFDRSGALALSGTRSGTLRVWDAVRGTLLLALDVKAGVYGAAFLDSTRVATCDGGGFVRTWSVPSGEKLSEFRAGVGAGFGVAVSPNGELLFTSTWQDKKVALWDLRGERPALIHEQILERGTMGVDVLDGGRRVAAGDGGLVSWGTWPTVEPAKETTETSPVGTHWGLALAPDGTRAWSATQYGALYRIDLAGGSHGVWARRGHIGSVSAVFECSLGVASVARDRTLRVWAPGGGELLEFRQEVPHDLFVASEHSDAALVGNRWNEQVSLLTPGAAPLLRTLPGSPGITALALVSPDEGMLVDSAGKLFAFSEGLAPSLPNPPFEGHDGEVLAVAVQPSGPLAASAGEDGTLRLWDRERRRQVGIFRGHEQPVRGVAFRGKLPELLSVGQDLRLRRWDIVSGSCTASLDAGDARGVTVDATGRLAATWDGSRVRLWDLARDAELDRVSLAPFRDRPSVVEFTADGKHLLVGTDLGVVYRFELRGL